MSEQEWKPGGYGRSRLAVPHPVIDVDVHVTVKQQPHDVCVTTHTGKRQGTLPLLGQDVGVSTLGDRKDSDGSLERQGPQAGQHISKAAASEAETLACPCVPRMDLPNLAGSELSQFLQRLRPR